jgi:hypothetical protein
MKVRFYRELWNHPTTRYPAIHSNDVVEREAYAVLLHPGEDLPGFDGCRLAPGQIKPFERYLRVVYVPEPDANSAFALTAVTLRGAVLRACRARQRSRGRHHRGERQRLQIYEDGSATRPWQGPDELPAGEQQFPSNWDEERVRRVIAHYLGQLAEAQVVEDESAARAAREPGATEAEPGGAPATGRDSS